jgi:aldose 1-epimerase
VAGTPFDFRAPRAIGAALDVDDEQLRMGGGFDHNFVLDRAEGAELALAARLHEPASGRTLEVYTTEPGLQLYSGQALGGVVGKGGIAYRANAGVALETQHFPDSPNHPSFPNTILRPGDGFTSRTVYRR